MLVIGSTALTPLKSTHHIYKTIVVRLSQDVSGNCLTSIHEGTVSRAVEQKKLAVGDLCERQ